MNGHIAVQAMLTLHRDHPMRRLGALPRAEHGRLILLTGVAGVGKTRLAEETVAAAAADGFQVLIGRCIENEGAPPFWPWVRTQYAYDHTLCGRGDRAAVERARLLIDEADALASHLGMPTLANDVATLKRELEARRTPMSVSIGHEAAKCQEHLRVRYGLTPAESRLALLLCEGRPLGSAARALDVSVHTARTQLSRIFTKTHTGRQIDLVRLLLGVLPFCADAL